MFLTGEFSKIAQVSKRSLHYYDDIGLLTPAHIDPESGYRYYSASQLPRLNRILALKGLGLTLDQIAKMLHSEISDEEIHGMLMIKKAEMEQAVLEDLQRLRGIEARIEENRRTEETLDVVIKSIPALPFLSTRTIFSTPEAMMALVDQILRGVHDRVAAGTLGSFGAVFYADDFTLTDNDADVGFYLKKPVKKPIEITDDCVLRIQNLPAVETMATAVQAGNPDLEFITFGKIGRWIEENGYRIAGPYREIVYGASSLADMADATIEIQMPVEKVAPAQHL